MLKSKNDCTCVLRDKKTGRKLITFSATQAVDPVFSAGFEGGGIASASQSFSIFTETVYKYKPYQHTVEIGDKTYILTSFSKSIRRRLGAGWGNRPRTVYILNLE